MYEWWVFVHIAGAFGFLIVHGVSIATALRLRNERDPNRINALLDTSGRTVMPLYISMAVLLAGGIVAGFQRHWWGFGWIWAALATLVVVTLAMYFMARPYYQKVRFITRAVAEGSQAVTPEQFDSVLRNRRPFMITWIGFAGLVFILYLMVLKPTLGLTPSEAEPVAEPTGTVVRIEAQNSLFATKTVTAAAGQAFSIRFRNADAGVLHNVSIYTNAAATDDVFKGKIFAGPATEVYKITSLDAGSYFFRCDVHPTTMTGTLSVS
ncbi:MAG: cupredoxin domain-containing protein [Actinomycetota bacterium]